MKLSSKKQATVVGLDIEAGSIAATEVITNGDVRVGRTGVAPLAPGVTRDGEIADSEALAATLKELFSQTKLPKEVRVGVANQRVVVRTLRLPQIEDAKEVETAIRFQAQDHIPMPLEQAVLDWQVIGQRVGEERKQMDVVVVAARSEMVSGLVRSLRDAGLQARRDRRRRLRDDPGPGPGGGDPGGRSGRLLRGARVRRRRGRASPAQVYVPAKLYCNLGDVTNLAVAQGSNCLFTRVSSFGIEGIAQRLAERRGLTLEHARQWLVHVGLERPVETIDGDPEIVAATRESLAEGASKLADELRLSLDYYAAQEGALAVEEIIACGPGTSIQGLRRPPPAGARLRLPRRAPGGARRTSTSGTAARLTLSYGLGWRSSRCAPSI